MKPLPNQQGRSHSGKVVESAPRDESSLKSRGGVSVGAADSISVKRLAATLSHELRTPLNAIVGSISLLELHTPHDSHDRVLVDRLKRNGRHLIAMLDDVLELLRAEFNQFTVSPGMRRLSIAVDEALADVEVNAAVRGVDIVNEVAGAAGDPPYWGDERRVRQIVVNLLTNAIKFTASGGRITISCGTKEAVTGVSMAGLGPWTYLRVVDTGRGIPPDRIASIFEPFHQVEPADQGSGAGLGLSISRQFARAMDGEITVSSKVSIGSVFTLWLHTKPSRTGPEMPGREHPNR